MKHRCVVGVAVAACGDDGVNFGGVVGVCADAGFAGEVAECVVGLGDAFSEA